MTDHYAEGCEFLANAKTSLNRGGPQRYEAVAAYAAIATACFAQAAAAKVAADDAGLDISPSRADVAFSEPTHLDHHRFLFRCGCLLTVPNENLDAPNGQTAHVFCPIHDPNARIPRELIEHWNTQHKEEPF